MSDMFTVIVRDLQGNAHRPSVNRNWTLKTFLERIKPLNGNVDIPSIGVDDNVHSADKEGNKTLAELGFVANKQITAFVTLKGGN